MVARFLHRRGVRAGGDPDGHLGASGMTIADPDDRCMMDVVGVDATDE